MAWARLRVAGHVALALWFAYNAWQLMAGTLSDFPAHFDVGIDGRLYYRAAATWLAGGDPWTAYTTTNTWPPTGAYIHFLFTGPPPTVLAFVPFVWIPEWFFVPLWLGVSLVAGIYTLRRLNLPIYWLLFPPMVMDITSGNPHVVALALLLCGSSWLRALAGPMKAYALIPQVVVLRQWRALGVVAVAGVVSLVVFWPLWSQYLRDYSTVQDWLIGATHGGMSAARDPRLFVLTAAALGALALVDNRAAGWLAVPNSLRLSLNPDRRPRQAAPDNPSVGHGPDRYPGSCRDESLSAAREYNDVGGWGPLAQNATAPKRCFQPSGDFTLNSGPPERAPKRGPSGPGERTGGRGNKLGQPSRQADRSVSNVSIRGGPAGRPR